MKIRSAVPENGCLEFLWRTEKNEKKQKKTKKTSVKHIRIRLIGGCVNKSALRHEDIGPSDIQSLLALRFLC